MPKYSTDAERLANAPIPAGSSQTPQERQAIIVYWRQQGVRRPSFKRVLEIYVESKDAQFADEVRRGLGRYVWYVIFVLYGFILDARRSLFLAETSWKHDLAENYRLLRGFAAALDMTTEELQREATRRRREAGR